jgi:spermidine synthase
MSDKNASPGLTNDKRVYQASLFLGVFLVSASGLMLEVTLTRIFSATIWYHFAFIAISVALFGWGLGGFFLHILKTKGLVKSTPGSLATASLLFSLSIPIFLWIIIRLPATPNYLSLYFIISVIPFFLAGIVLAQVFDIYRELTGKLYFADLIGASFGALGITLIIGLLGGESTVLFIAALPGMTAILFSTYRPDFLKTITFYLGLGSIIAVVLLIAFNSAFEILTIKDAPAKGLYQHMEKNPKLHIVFTRWNSYSRIDGVEGFPHPHIARIYIDSDAWTNVVGWDGKTESIAEETKEWFRYIPFHLEPEPKALIIGPGGGVDVMLSLVAGSKNVTAVELNPIIADFVRQYRERAGNLYNNQNVSLTIDEGRNFISRSKEKYDIISLSFVDSWASVSSGGLALSENFLYTTEAFHEYFKHLTDRGILVFIRWQVDIPRLVSNAVSMMQEHGISPEQAGNHIAVLLENTPQENKPTQMIFMLKKTPFTQEETLKIKDLSSPYNAIHIPNVTSIYPYKELFGGKISPSEFYAGFDVKVNPVRDDSPFYFANEKPHGVPGYLVKLLLIPILATILFFVLSAFCSNEINNDKRISFLFYFIALGLGFMYVEISILQKFILLLGHPIFTLSVILFSLLVSGGIGSFISHRFSEEAIPRRISLVCLLVFLISIAYALALPRLIPVLLPFSIETRIAITFILLFPLGVLMGMPFPLGIRIVGSSLRTGIPFYWGLNGIMSVFGSITAVIIGVAFGFTFTTLAGSASYLVAAICATLFATRAR